MRQETLEDVKRYLGFLLDEHGFEVAQASLERVYKTVATEYVVVLVSPKLTVRFSKEAGCDFGIEVGAPGLWDWEKPECWYNLDMIRDFLAGRFGKDWIGVGVDVTSLYLKENLAAICELFSPANFTRTAPLLNEFEHRREEDMLRELRSRPGPTQPQVFGGEFWPSPGTDVAKDKGGLL